MSRVGYCLIFFAGGPCQYLGSEILQENSYVGSRPDICALQLVKYSIFGV